MTADAAVDDVVSSIDVEEKNTLYAVWEKDPDTPDATTYKWDFEDASTQVLDGCQQGLFHGIQERYAYCQYGCRNL